MNGSTNGSEDGMTLEAVEEKQEIETKTMTWRVFRRDPGTVTSVTRWIEEESLTGEGQFGYYPDATEVGAKYGEGDYILLRQDDEVHAFATASVFSVVGDTIYRRASEDDGES